MRSRKRARFARVCAHGRISLEARAHIPVALNPHHIMRNGPLPMHAQNSDASSRSLSSRATGQSTWGSFSWAWTKESFAARRAAWDDAAARHSEEQREREIRLRAKGALSSGTEASEDGGQDDGFAEDDVYGSGYRDSAVPMEDLHSTSAVRSALAEGAKRMTMNAAAAAKLPRPSRAPLPVGGSAAAAVKLPRPSRAPAGGPAASSDGGAAGGAWPVETS